ncbi:hypothetical protein TNCV_3426901 [Trichonephila clavipes]|nr:hypothetical protein TNCV_3426901 [Trichonephila clavipes]
MVLKATAIDRRKSLSLSLEEFRRPRSDIVCEGILTSHCSATRGLSATDLVNLNHGQVTGTTPELKLSLITTTPTGGRLSSRQI